MSKNKIVALIPVIGVMFLNLSSPDISVSGGEKPAINFNGKLQDTNGDTYRVENITISGMYKQIPMYKKPNQVTTKPNSNITRIDLSEISTIMVPEKKVLTFDGRDYIELEITYKDPKKTQERFIIEMHKRIWCDQINQAGPIEKDLAFDAIESVSIEGYKMAELAESKNKNDSKKTVALKSSKNYSSRIRERLKAVEPLKVAFNL